MERLEKRNTHAEAQERLQALGLDSKQQLLLDLNQRADRGIYVHVCIWPLIAALGELIPSIPVFVIAVMALFTAQLAARLFVRRRWDGLVKHHPRRAQRIFNTLLLWPALQWGVLVALCALWPPLAHVESAMLVVISALAAIGASTFGISRFLRRTYPLALLVPAVAASLHEIDPSRYLLLTLLGVFMVYLEGASQTAHDEYWASAADKYALRQLARRLATQSSVDALTQVHNRFHFDTRLEAEWSRARRSGDELSLLMIDLDHFKSINDTCGHPAGDRCLKEAATALRKALQRSNDLLARYGGEEFVVLLPGADHRAAMDTAEHLRRAVHELDLFHGTERLELSCSIGAATMRPRRSKGWPQLMDSADAALYAAKKQGRNCVVSATSMQTEEG